VLVGVRTIVTLALCAAAAGAALAHCAIDFAGDYVLASDSYDHLAHGSRELLAGVAVLFATLLAWRGLRVCCDIAAANRNRLARPVFRARETLVTCAVASGIAAAIVPAMEWFDGRLDGAAVGRLDDAFGGSIALGLFLTVVCACAVGLFVCALARWLISHRDAIVTIIETLLGQRDDAGRPSGYDLAGWLFTFRRRRPLTALRLAKRGPPVNSFA
jgi:hypothetical protein